MPDVAFFQRLGMFSSEKFLDADLCRILQTEMCLPQSISSARITNQGIERVDEAIRKTKLVRVSDNLKHAIEERLAAIKPEIEAHFGVELDICEDPNFLAYSEGDFFKPHTDSSTSEQAQDCVQQRTVSVVLFLNGESSNLDSDGYMGGSLILYGLIKNPSWENYGFNIQGKPGLLIAFASDVYHEVTLVTKGMRFTMVTWYPAKVLATPKSTAHD